MMKKLLQLIVLFSAFALAVQSSFAQWESCSQGIPSNTIQDIAIKGINIYACCFRGLFKSTDNGNSWTQKNNGLTNITMTSLAINSGYIYAGTFNGGIFMTIENGENWKNSGLSGKTVYCISNMGNNILAGTNGEGIYISSDTGDTWENMGLNGNSIYAIAFKGNNIIAGGAEGIFISSDLGKTWEPKPNGISGLIIQSIQVVNGNIFIGTNNGVFFSSDNGDSWIDKSTGLAYKVINNVMSYGNYILAGGGMMGNGGLFMSSDMGNNWNKIENGLTNNDIRALAVGETHIFAGTYGGAHLYRVKISDLISDVPEIQKEVIFSVFPNPASEFIEISYSPSIKSGAGGVSDDTRFRIFDVYGRKVMSAELSSEPASTIRIDVSSLPAGVYFIKIGNETKKLILNK